MKIRYLFLLLLPFLLSFQTGDSLKEEIGRFLKKRLPGYEKIDFEIASKPLTPMGEEVKIDTLKELRLNGSAAYVPVVLMDRDKKVSQSYVSLKVSLYKKVLVAKRSLPSGSELKTEDFSMVLMDVAKLRGAAISDAGALTGMRAKFMIKEGEALTAERLQAMPVVKKGDSVTAISVKGNVEISFDAQARQDGSLGEVIRIITPEKRIFRARVIDQFSVNIVE